MRKTRVDPYDFALARIREGHSPEEAFRLGRNHFGGDTPYIRKLEPVELRTQALAQALQQQQPLAQAFASAGLSRASGFRHLLRRSR